MKAVNLMPVDPRTSRVQGMDRSIGSHVVIASLALLAVFAAVWTITSRQVDTRGAELIRVNAEAQAAEKRAAGAAEYVKFTELARNRKATVMSLSATRFDWAHALHEISRVLPGDVWLMQLDGTSGASSSAPTPATSAAPAPSFELQGCTRSQADVARLMTRLRAVDRVRSVGLTSSIKPDTGGSDQCPANRPRDPVFTIVVKFAAPGESKAAVDSTGQIPAPAAAEAAAASSDGSPAGSGASNSAPKSSATTGAG